MQLNYKKLWWRVIFDAGVINYATTDLLKTSSQKLLDYKYTKFVESCKQGLEQNDLLKAIDNFCNCKLIVIGDRYLTSILHVKP